MSELVKEQAKERMAKIAKCTEKLQAKLKADPNSPKAANYKKRLEEYAASTDILEFIIKTGRYITLKDGGGTGTVVNVPTGDLKVGG